MPPRRGSFEGVEAWEEDGPDANGDYHWPEESSGWDPRAAQGGEADLDEAFQQLNESHSQDGKAEKALLSWLRKELARLFREPWQLEPFGSFVTDLGLHSSGTRSDLDVVLLFRNHHADSFEAKSVREILVSPSIDRLGRWLQSQPSVTVKNIIRKARVPIVMFETKDLEVDISVQQPFGVLNSWHLRDLCASGLPGRLRALVRLIKQWAKSKAIHSAKSGGLSSYGWAMLAVGFLQETGLLPALIHERRYLTADDALWYVLEARDQRPEGLWGEPQPQLLSADGESPEEAFQWPPELFRSFLQWMQREALKPLESQGYGYGSLPLSQRHIVSVRGLQSQQELRRAVASCPKADHWNPAESEVFMLIEEPFTGENVARAVRADGFRDIVAEVTRAGKAMENADAEAAFQELLAQPALASSRASARDGVGLWNGSKGARKRPWSGVEEQRKRPHPPPGPPPGAQRWGQSWQPWR